MKLKLLFGSIAASLTHPAVAADPMLLENEPVVITATRLATPIKTTLPHTTLIDQEDIRKSGARDLSTLLRQEAGLEITQSGGLGQPSSLFTRGTNSSHTLVLIDGIPVNSATAGGAALDQIMLDQVDRVEIARGNLSSLYGSQAIGGVIQIFTQAIKAEPGGSVSAGLGSYRTARGALGYQYATETTQLGVSVSALNSDGYSAINADDVRALPFPSRDSDRDGYRNRSVSAHARYRYAQDQSFGISAFHSDAKTKFDDLFESNNSSKPKLTVGSLSFENRIAAAWQSHVRLGASIDDSKFFNADVFTSRFKTTNNKLEWQNDVQVFDGHKLVLGLDSLQQRVAYDDGFGAIDKSRRSTAGFLGYVATFAGGHSLQGNLRHDRYSDVGGRTTGLLGGGYALTDRFTLTAIASTAFRAPTFVDLYYPAPFGNPDLKPERAQSAEFGIQYTGGYGFGKVVYFRNRVKDLIGPASGTFFPVNINRAQSDGVELSYDALFGNTTLRASATAQNPVDENSGERLLRRAKRFGSINVAYQFDKWNLGGEIVASGPKQDIRVDDFSTKVRVPGYAVVNLKTTYNVAKQTRVVGRLDNLLNKKYQLVHGYNREERSAYLDLIHEF